MIGQLYSTAESAPGSLAQRLLFRRLEGARGPIAAMVGFAISAVILVALGEAFGLLISNTDSAAPAGVYRVFSREVKRGDLVAACLSIPIAQEGLARGYLRTGGCPATPSPSTRSSVPCRATWWTCSTDGSRSMACDSRTALSLRTTVQVVGSRTSCGAGTWLPRTKCGSSASTIAAVGTRATSDRFRSRMYAATLNRF